MFGLLSVAKEVAGFVSNTVGIHHPPQTQKSNEHRRTLRLPSNTIGARPPANCSRC